MRLNLSQYAFVEIPDELPLTANNKLNVIFQYRWHAAAPPDKSKYVKALVIYGDHPGLNAGNAGELCDYNFVNKSIEKLLTHTKCDLGKVGFSAFSGGGIALYNLFKNKNKLICLPDGIILSDAGYGGRPVVPVWKDIAKEYINESSKRFVLLHTRSLEKDFTSTTKTANSLIKELGIENNTVKTEESDFWKDWNFRPSNITISGGIIILDAPQATHLDAGKIVPQLWDSFLIDWF